jgi:hypothetical protein
VVTLLLFLTLESSHFDDLLEVLFFLQMMILETLTTSGKKKRFSIDRMLDEVYGELQPTK